MIGTCMIGISKKSKGITRSFMNICIMNFGPQWQMVRVWWNSSITAKHYYRNWPGSTHSLTVGTVWLRCMRIVFDVQPEIHISHPPHAIRANSRNTSTACVSWTQISPGQGCVRVPRLHRVRNSEQPFVRASQTRNILHQSPPSSRQYTTLIGMLQRQV